MIDPAFHVVELPGPVESAGHAYGRACAHLFEPTRLDRYLRDMLRLKRSGREAIAVHAEAWARRLPEHHQRQIEAMAEGAGVSAPTVRQFLYADIAPPADARGDDPRSLVSGDGPMCSGVVVERQGSPWVALNCDWYEIRSSSAGASKKALDVPSQERRGRLTFAAAELHPPGTAWRLSTIARHI